MNATPPLVLAAGLLLATAAGAQLSSVGPFPGTLTEDWSTQPNTPKIVACIPGGAFGGVATVCAPGSLPPGGSGVVLASVFAHSCPVFPKTGERLFGATTYSEWVFDPPVRRFGAWFATPTDVPDGAITFFGVTNERIGSDVVIAPADCTWHWNGWASTIPIARIRMYGNDSGALFFEGADLLVDDARIDLAFSGSPPSISASEGGVQSLVVDAGPEFGGDAYLVLGSAGGTWPGVPIDGVTVPLVPDAYTALTLSEAGGALFPGSVGVLDPAGEASAQVVVPPGTAVATAGLTLHHAFLVVRASPTPHIAHASNAAPLLLLP